MKSVPESERFELIRKDGSLRQVKTAGGLSDIQELPGHGEGYVINFYKAQQVGARNADGLFTFSGSPERSLRVENPNRQKENYKSVKITETTGGIEKTNTHDYNSANREWTQILPDGTKIVMRETLPQNIVPKIDPGIRPASTVALNHFERTKERYSATGTLIGRTKYVVWLTSDESERILQEIKDYGGLNITTTHGYYNNTNVPRQYGQLKQTENSDGSWIYYVVDADGRITKEYTPHGDTPLPATGAPTENACRTSEYLYVPTAPGDVLLQNDQRARTVIERTAGIETARRYYAYPKNNDTGESREITERAAAQNAAFGTAGNLRVTTTYFSNNAGEASAGKVKTIQQPDGQLTTYSYALNPNAADAYLVTTKTDGTIDSPGGVSGKTLQTKTTEDNLGRTRKTETFAYIAGAYVPVNVFENIYDTDGHVIEKKKNGRTIYNATYANDQLVRETDETGITTEYAYDVMGKIETATRKAIGGQPDIVTTYERTLGGIDCGCDGSLQITITAGELSLTSKTVKDNAGRVTEQTDTAGLTTTYAYTNGGKTITVVKPDTATETRQSRLDGRLASITGDGIANQYYTAGINADGTQWEKTTLGSPDGARWTKTTGDYLGRTIRTEKPGFAGATITETRTYDNITGRLAVTKQTVTGGSAPASSLSSVIYNLSYFYDAVGNVIKTEITRGDITNTTETGTAYIVDSGSVWRESFQKQDGITTARSRSRVGASLATPAIASESWTMSLPQSNAPTPVWDETTATHQLVTHDRTTATQVAVSKHPTSAQPAIQTTVAGLTISTVSPSHGGTTLYRYDALGRQTGVKQPRHSMYSEIEYNDKDQVVKTADAAGNATTYLYYENGYTGAGQLRMVTDALGGTVFKQYDLAGNEIYTWGSATYPVAQAYDIYGQRVLLRTFRDTTFDFSSEHFNLNTENFPSGDTTTWTYDEATGALLQKTYADGKGPTYDYYADGQLRTRLWARLNPATGERLATNYAYNAQGQLSGIDYSDGTPDVTYTYNNFGQPLTITDGTGTRTYDYDPATFALTAENYISGIHAGNVLHRAYDAHNRPTGYALTGNASGSGATTESVLTAASYTYDANDRLNSVSGDTIPAGLNLNAERNTLNANMFSYARLANSDLIETVTGPVHRVLNAYEPNRDVLIIKTNQLNTGAIVSRYAYTYDALARRTTRTQSGTAFDGIGYAEGTDLTTLAEKLSATGSTLGTPGAGTSTDTFSYNPRSEVTGSINNKDATLNRGYTYDPIGNRVSSTEGAIVNERKKYAANNLNQYSEIRDASLQSSVISFEYDADGNTRFDGSGRSFNWDCENRLIGVVLPGNETICYEYDFQNRRIERRHTKSSNDVETEVYTYDNWNVITEKNILNHSFINVKIYTWGCDLSNTFQGAGGVGGLLAENCHSQKSKQFFYFYDVNGNVTELVNAFSCAEVHLCYDAFGEVIKNYSIGECASYQFSTKSYDCAANLSYYGNRYLNATQGRWINRDPSEERGGMSVYAFIANRALCLYDILGLVSNAENLTIYKNFELFDHDRFSADDHVGSGKYLAFVSCNKDGNLEGSVAVMLIGDFAEVQPLDGRHMDEFAGVRATAGGTVRVTARYREDSARIPAMIPGAVIAIGGAVLGGAELAAVGTVAWVTGGGVVVSTAGGYLVDAMDFGQYTAEISVSYEFACKCVNKNGKKSWILKYKEIDPKMTTTGDLYFKM